jgi:PrtD family type I secretion system ABC transporter
MRALGSCRQAFFAAAIFSLFINGLMLVQPLYMMEVYNRVLPTQSTETLLVLTGLVIAMLAVMALLDALRSRLLIRVSGRLDLTLSNRILAAAFRATLRNPRAGAAEGLRDFDTIRQFVSGPGTNAFFDAPWTPVMIGLTFMFHPLLGWVAVAGGIILFALAALNEWATRKPIEAANRHASAMLGTVAASLRNAETMEAMGMFGNVSNRAFERRNEMLRLQEVASDRAATITAVSKVFRIVLQVALLGLGAWLVIHQAMSPGGIIASSIVVGRALAPIETAVGTWKHFIAARSAWSRLNELLAHAPDEAPRTELPRPTGALAVEDVTVRPPGSKTATLNRVSLTAQPGEVIGVVGPSGGGKSTLARLLVGAWQPYRGTVRLDGADVHQWNREELGPHVGYLPQDVELFEGTVAENIARFGMLDSEKIVAAAKMAGVHEMILRLPQGYETEIGQGGSVLSGGQRQRIGLARALYGDPVLLVLDEPNSNLDQEGEGALVRAVLDMKQAGTTVVLITHRPSVLNAMDTLVLIADGEIRMSGPRNEMIARLTRPMPVDTAQRGAGPVAAPAPAVARS